MKFGWVFAVFLIGSTTPALADAEFELCESNADRHTDEVRKSVAMMTCLREQSQRELATARQRFGDTDTGPYSNWTLGIRNDPMNGQKIVQMITDGPEGTECGGAPTRVTLELRCQNNTTTLTIGGPACFLVSGIGDYGRVTYRAGDKAPHTIDFVESTDNEVLGLWSGRRSIPVIRDLFNETEMQVRLKPYRQREINIRFDITGIETVIKDLRTTCSW